MVNKIFYALSNINKVLNYINLKKDVLSRNKKPSSYPFQVVMSLSNTCDHSCPICSVNNLERAEFRRVKNQIPLEHIKIFSEIFEKAVSCTFAGFIGESILNPEFDTIIRYLKSKFDLKLNVSTNGWGMNEQVQNTMLDIGFDSVSFSIHAATPETHRVLQGSDFNRVMEHLQRLQSEKRRRNLLKPHVSIEYALNKKNIHETKKMLDIACRLKVDRFNIYHYHDYGFSGIELNSEPEFANKMIDDIYRYAEEKGATNILPRNPPYYKTYKLENVSLKEIKCFLPWYGLQMRSSYSHTDSYYVGCCNVFNTFLFNYKEHLETYGKLEFKKIWHHPVFQHLRNTVNTTSGNKRNPLCKYCKSKQRTYLKAVDNSENYRKKLEAINGFFESFQEEFDNIEDIEGLKVLYTEDAELKTLAGS